MVPRTNDLFDDVREGAEFSHTLLCSHDAMHLFAQLSGDRSPIHVDEEFARARGFDGCVVYGNLLGAMVSTLVGMKLGGPDVMIASQTINFRKPVCVGAEVRLTAKVAQRSEASRLAELQLRFVVGEQLVASGKCQVKFL